jgi:hypothetical protein
MEIEHVENVMAVPVFGLLCAGLFVLMLLAAGIAALVVVIRWISWPADERPRSNGFGVATMILGGVGAALLLLLMVGFTSVVAVRSHAPQVATEHMAPMPPPPPRVVEVEPPHLQRQRQAEIEAIVKAKMAETQARMEQDAEALRRRVPEPILVPTAPPTPQPVSATEAVAVAHAPESLPPTDDRSTTEAVPSANPPDWIHSGTKTVGESTFVVISSKLYATEDEARYDADEQLRELLKKDLRQHTSSTIVRPHETVGLQESMKVAIRGTYVETSNRDLGSFFAPMHRVWYYVELSPTVREPALMRWRATLAETRMVTVAGTVLALLCAPLAVVLYGVGNRATGGKIRRLLAGGLTSAVVAVWVLVGVFFARAFVWWG